jgi:hypothetical protein
MSLLNTYWGSTKANKIFQPTNEDKDALEAVDNQIELLLLCVLESPKGYWKVISQDGEAEYEVTGYQKWWIHLKCQYMYSALNIAKEKMSTIQNWDKCCQLAREMMLLSGVRLGRCSRTIQNWYLDFTKRDRTKRKLAYTFH